jgi:hypothetical protein
MPSFWTSDFDLIDKPTGRPTTALGATYPFAVALANVGFPPIAVDFRTFTGVTAVDPTATLAARFRGVRYPIRQRTFEP